MLMDVREQSIGRFLDALGAKVPTPGGGAAASVAAGLGAAVAQMVLSYSQGKKNLAEHDQLHEQAITQLKQATDRALDLAAADAEVYGRLNALWRLERDDPVRKEQWEGAVAAATDVPRQLLAVCVEVLELMQQLVGRTNRMLDSDLAIAGVLADAAARASAWNVRINLPLFDDTSAAAAIEAEVVQMLSRCDQLREQIERGCRVGASGN